MAERVTTVVDLLVSQAHLIISNVMNDTNIKTLLRMKASTGGCRCMPKTFHLSPVVSIMCGFIYSTLLASIVAILQSFTNDGSLRSISFTSISCQQIQTSTFEKQTPSVRYQKAHRIPLAPSHLVSVVLANVSETSSKRVLWIGTRSYPMKFGHSLVKEVFAVVSQQQGECAFPA